MRYDYESLVAIVDRDGGRCHLCGSRRAFGASLGGDARGGASVGMSTRAFRRQMGYEPAGSRRGTDWTGPLLVWAGIFAAAYILDQLRQLPMPILPAPNPWGLT